MAHRIIISSNWRSLISWGKIPERHIAQVTHGGTILGRESAGYLVCKWPVSVSVFVQQCSWEHPLLKVKVLPRGFWCGG